MLTWLEEVAASSELHGTDIDADAVAWIGEHLPFVTVQVNGDMPPLSYANGYFDLVYNHSVFTHIDEARQDAWLAELCRVTRPGAHLVLTVHGEHAFSKFEDARRITGRDVAALREMFDTKGLVFMAEEAWQRFFPAWYGSTYHATWYVFAHWSRWFRVRAYLPRGVLDFQDMVLLERRDDDDDDDDAYLRAGQRRSAEEAPGIAEAQALLARGTDLTSRSRFGALGSAWRRALRILLRNYALHERQVNEALVRALREHDERLARIERRGR
jgi:SAM-dependent methyltransferase